MEGSSPSKEVLEREGILSFETSTQIYRLKIIYSERLNMIEMHAEERKSYEFYVATILQQNLPNNLLFFQDVQSIYQFLSANPTQTMSYNVGGKFITIKDSVGKKLKNFNIPLKKRTMTASQIVEFKLRESENRVKQLQEERQKWKTQLDHALRKISIIEEQLKEEKQGRQIDQVRRVKAQQRMEWMIKQNSILRRQLRIEQRQQLIQESITHTGNKKRQRAEQQPREQKIQQNTQNKTEKQKIPEFEGLESSSIDQYARGESNGMKQYIQIL